MATARTRARTSPLPGGAKFTSATSSGFLNPRQIAARMVFLPFLGSGRHCSADSGPVAPPIDVYARKFANVSGLGHQGALVAPHRMF
jgi:hypothetical protein